MSDRDVYIVSAARTPIASFQGAFSKVPATELGSAAIRGALSRASLSGDAIDETYMGMVLPAGTGQAPARQAAKGADVPDKTPATTVNKVCGSGMMSLILGAKAILLGDADVVVAGGMESMTNAPFLLPKARGGFRMGNGTVVDSMIHDGLWNPYDDSHMGQCGELCASELGYSREQQDAFALESYRRAQAAQEAGLLAQEIVPFTVKGRRGDTVVELDEEPAKLRADKVPTLRPAFRKDGTITAANASKLNDGAAALVLASGKAVKERGLTPIAKLRGYGGHAQAPEWFTTAPVGAISNVLSRTGVSASDVDLWEINEAFAVVTMACAAKAELDLSKVNVRGGAVALGHPIGASGARIVVTLLHALAERDARLGGAAICLGGGEALSLLVERV